jgi:hypothetical protein
MSYLTYVHYFLHQSVGTRPLWTIGILCILVGLQISFTGFLADLIIHLSHTGNGSSDFTELLQYSTDKK